MANHSTNVSAAPARRRRLARQLTRQRLQTFALITLAVAISASVYVFRDDVRKLRDYGYLGAFGLPLIGNSLVAVPFPWILIIGQLGQSYSHILITLTAASGAATGDMVGFFLGHKVSESWRDHKIVQWLVKRPRWQQTVVIIAMSFSPVFAYASVAAGILRYPPAFTFALIFLGEGTKIYIVIEAAKFGAKWFG
ncbi:MAG: hypothetical protein HY261_02955 [Chloroflexi bacterium]|nr:hypothetical protein [Chloroflexota bacterium]